MKNTFVRGALVLAVAVSPLASAHHFSPKKNPEQLLSTIHTLNLIEIRLGTLAQQVDASPAVRAYGARIASRHRAADAALKAFASSLGLMIREIDYNERGISPFLYDLLDHAQQIKAEYGSEFDLYFSELMVNEHAYALSVLYEAQFGGREDAVSQYLSRLIPAVAEGYQSALQLPKAH